MPTQPEEELTRIAIVKAKKCRPKKCNLECRRNCPPMTNGLQVIDVTKESKIAVISETLCIGCGICVHRCPMEAIAIERLPKSLDKEMTHRYGPNTFKLHRLPRPRPGQVLGLVGTNGIGKSTALQVLSGKIKPNLGRFKNPPDWSDILAHFRGSELQNYFTRLLDDDLKAQIKPQNVDFIKKRVSGTVGAILKRKNERKVLETMTSTLELNHLMDRKVKQLSGGELQRFAIAATCLGQFDIYMFDEPSSYLDIRQRLVAAQVIRGMTDVGTYVLVVEHDLSVLDYLSDYVCCLTGKPSVYGVVSMPFSVREGINVFLKGKIPTENLRFRPFELDFKVASNVQAREITEDGQFPYPSMTKELGDFKLSIVGGQYNQSEIIVMLGQNGTGKTTFIRMLAGHMPPTTIKGQDELGHLHVSYKPQRLGASFEGTVQSLLHSKIRSTYMMAQFQTDVMKPLHIKDLFDQQVKNLSFGQLQRVAIALSLGKPADIYLLDEPSAYLDSEQRIIAARVIKRFILHSKKTAFIVEHDFIMATYLADKVIVYSGEPGVACVANKPQSLLSGMNAFLKSLEITFRRDPTNYRPRINKLNSSKDRMQKQAGQYFHVDNSNADSDDEEEEPVPKPRSGRRPRRT